MARIIAFVKKEPMLIVSVLAALASFFITPPGLDTVKAIDWKTLATLLVLLSVLDGFKHENLFAPVIRLTSHIHTQTALTFFLVFGVFFSSMFVTNDVSLIIFAPLTIILFRAGGKERFTIPVLALENVAAVRGSLLTPFGSPQNLFLYGKSGMSTGEFMLMMLPLWLMSIVLLSTFILFLYRRNLHEEVAVASAIGEPWDEKRRGRRILYLVLFAVIIAAIVTRTELWPYVTGLVMLALFIFARRVFVRVDYVLLLTFLCFFIFSSSVAANETIADFLSESVAGNEYWWSLGISQIISNVPASIVLWPFTSDLRSLIYGLDTAGLITVIGSLASVINLRIYVREYPGRSKNFIWGFTKVSIAFFIVAAPIQWVLLELVF